MKRTRSLAMTGILIALSVILTRFASFRLAIGGIEGIRLGFGSMPNIIAGIVLGPWYGAIAGAFSDVAGFMLSPMGVYMPHFTLSSALMGAIPGAVFRLSKQNKERAQASIVHLGIAVFCGTAIVSWGLTPYFLHVIFGLDYRVIMPPRLVAGAIEIMTYSMVLKTVYSPVSRIALRTQAPL
ncbi:MAG: folate family ECF transporter S component [Bacillota bacterium]